ncbi:putative glycosidase C21B10.07 [Grifola frondosa]|uniref:Putative glycosidase C21B10.07 n=1 Tax=Grifola frondosa TaxID=5627 RepID=A0A1C7MLX6_GRIFR|nr:putative glycosidase C21B10.07 [Grifola frondosa]
MGLLWVLGNLTLSNVTWVDEATATSQQLAYINDAGNAIIKVDNTTTVANGSMRNSIRITTQDLYDYGSIWVMDAVHLPYGCSVWPAFWAKGPLWPNDGEIDIVEGINLMNQNQMALHTLGECVHQTPPDQKSPSGNLNCSTGTGCTVRESSPNSFGAGFAAAGGGVWATQFDISGIYIWFWSRPDVPSSFSVGNTSIDISQWGPPSASYPVTSQCNLTQFFTSQQLVIDIALCGDWAGVPSIYSSSCKGTCYLSNVVGPGSPTYDDAYFEIKYVRTYTVSAGLPIPPIRHLGQCGDDAHAGYCRPGHEVVRRRREPPRGHHRASSLAALVWALWWW